MINFRPNTSNLDQGTLLNFNKAQSNPLKRIRSNSESNLSNVYKPTDIGIDTLPFKRNEIEKLLIDLKQTDKKNENYMFLLQLLEKRKKEVAHELRLFLF